MEEIAKNIAYSVQIATAPTTSPEQRFQASKFCNDFIQSTPADEMCAVGFLLATHSDLVVRRTGLQFLEHVAKFAWQNVSNREEIKEKLFVLMQTGMTDDCPQFLEEALARVIVEIAKREWPQLWPNLFPRLFEIASSSDLSLLVLRRMVEDVATLQTVDCQERRRELNQSLNAISLEVISTFFRVLIESVKQYHETAAPVYQRRAKVCLGCLLPYIESTNPSTFAKDNMVPTLFALLPDFYFQMNAAECILQLVERKPSKKEDRFEITSICLSAESFPYFLQSIYSAQPNNVDFLRKLGDILTNLAANAVIGKVSVENFLQGCEKLGIREEAVAVLGSTVAVNHFLKTLEKDSQAQGTIMEDINKFLIRLLTLILQKFVTAPPKSIEREEMGRLKNEYSALLKTVGKRVPLYKEVNGWLRNSLASNSIQNFQFEALTLVVDAVASSVSENDAETIKIGLMDLEACYAKFNVEESLELKSLILSLVSALFVFLSLAKKRGEFTDTHQHLMISIFDSIFKCFNLEDSPATREIRRHCSALLIKLSVKFPDVLALGFDFIYSSARNVAHTLNTMEYRNILESMMEISNAWNDAGKQSTFLASLFNAEEWQQVAAIVDTPTSFLSNLAEDIFLEKRALMIRALGTAHGSLSRVKKQAKHSSSTVLQLNQNSGNREALGNGDNNSNIGALHPAYDHICPLLPIVLKTVKTIHSIVEIPDFAYIEELSEGERISVLGLGYSNNAQVADAEKSKSHKEKIKSFVLGLQELVYDILGESCSFGPRFYSMPQLGDAYLSFVGYNSQLLNDFRLRNIIRVVFKNFLLCCPTAQTTGVVIPFAQKFFPFMLERLINRWSIIESTKSLESEGEEEKEILENASLRLLTKEYIELLERLLEKHSTETLSAGVDVDMDNAVESKGGAGSPNGNEVGEVGNILLSDSMCFTTIVNCLVASMCWDDSIVCLKATRCILMMLDRLVPLVDVARGTFTTALRAVCFWVESESNMDSLLKILDGCFKYYRAIDPQFIQLLKDWGAPEAEIQKLVGLCNFPKNEKKRKDIFRKLVLNNPSLEKNKCPKSQWLKGLPQLKLPTEERRRSPEIDLTHCFSLIHK